MLRKFLRIIMGTSAVLPDAKQSPAVPALKIIQKERELIKRESQVGSTLFGAVPKGRSRDFFCLDQSTWVWHEQWIANDGKTNCNLQIRYEFQTRGVLKTVDGIHSGYIDGKELTDLISAIQQYHRRVASEVYGYQLNYA
ncbi:hypothetical protein KC974_02525 [Candidatus Saccharibacteria bacterium]|nr:hypothetical protein [Candidatus Saccharibacteria bacterium]